MYQAGAQAGTAIQTIDVAVITDLLAALAKKPAVFWSEKDFQLHLAWETKQRGWELHLEYDPECFKANAAIEILVLSPERVAFELNYKTTSLLHGLWPEPPVKNQVAQHIG
jgi:hypothetical protein